MSWDPVWEKVFATKSWGKYPSESLIKFIARNYYMAPDRKEIKVLELGCGAGANLWFLAREGFSAFGVDGSESALEQAKNNLSKDGFEAELILDDVANIDSAFGDHNFDAVIDIACLQCNSRTELPFLLNQSHAVLKKGGRFFSVMLCDESSGSETGTRVDINTYKGIEYGPLKGVGVNHFLSENDLNEFYSPLYDVKYEKVSFTYGDRGHKYVSWLIEGVKR